MTPRLRFTGCLDAGEIEVVGLLTTVNEAFDRVAMHGVRRELLDAQAAALGLDLHVVELPWPCTNEVYERLMGAAVASAVQSGVDAIVFGDLFLEDVRRYREQALVGSGLRPLFPLWQRPTPARRAAGARDRVRRARAGHLCRQCSGAS